MTPHASASRGICRLRAVGVAMAACVAPSYFLSVHIGGYIYEDGGLLAVASAQVALHELKHFLGVDPGRV